MLTKRSLAIREWLALSSHCFFPFPLEFPEKLMRTSDFVLVNSGMRLQLVSVSSSSPLLRRDLDSLFSSL